MNKQDTLRNLLVAGAVFIFIMAVGPALIPPPPPPRTPVDPIPSAQPADESFVAEPAKFGTPPPIAPTPSAPTTTAGASWNAIEAPAAQTFDMGAAHENLDKHGVEAEAYRTKLVLSNVGASVESAFLTDHAAHLRQPDRYPLLSPVKRTNGAAYRSFTVDKINIDGADLALGDKRWHCEGVTAFKIGDEEGQVARFQLDLQRGDQPALRLTRTLRLPMQPTKLGRHDLYSDLTAASLDNQPHNVILTYRGGVGIPMDPTRDDRVIDAGVQAEPGRITVTRKVPADAAKAGKPVPLFVPTPAQPSQKLSWAATGNTYFTCTLAPLAADGKSPAPYLSEVSALDADADPATTDDVTIRFVTSSAALQPGESITYPAALYLGEKDGRAFREQPDYGERNYYFQISQGFGWCTFTWLVELMIWLLNSLHFVVRDFGIAIIILVLLVRAMLHPLTKKGQVNMARMQRRMADLAPKIEEIKKKFANDKARMNQEMIKLNLNPAGQLMSCLPMLIQMPIWVALYLSLSNNILMRHEAFLFTWVKDLTAQDALVPFSTSFFVPLVGWRMDSFNLLPILVSVFMYLQQKTQPKPPPNPNMSDEQRQQQEMMQKMMPIMSIMMLFIFYSMPSGLNLYIMFSSLFGWLEQLVIRKHIKEQEAAGTFDAPPPKSDSRGDRPDKPPGKHSWFERLQKMAADAQKTQHTQRARPKR